MSNDRYSIVSISFFGDKLPVEDMEKMTGIKTRYSGLKGTHIKGDPRLAKHKTNVWSSIMFTSSKQGGLTKNIQKIINRMIKNKAKLKKLLKTKGIYGTIYISLEMSVLQGAEIIPVSQLKILSDLNIRLDLDITS